MVLEFIKRVAVGPSLRLNLLFFTGKGQLWDTSLTADLPDWSMETGGTKTWKQSAGPA